MRRPARPEQVRLPGPAREAHDLGSVEALAQDAVAGDEAGEVRELVGALGQRPVRRQLAEAGAQLGRGAPCGDDVGGPPAGSGLHQRLYRGPEGAQALAVSDAPGRLGLAEAGARVGLVHQDGAQQLVLVDVDDHRRLVIDPAIGELEAEDQEPVLDAGALARRLVGGADVGARVRLRDGSEVEGLGELVADEHDPGAGLAREDDLVLDLGEDGVAHGVGVGDVEVGAAAAEGDGRGHGGSLARLWRPGPRHTLSPAARGGRAQTLRDR